MKLLLASHIVLNADRLYFAAGLCGVYPAKLTRSHAVDEYWRAVTRLFSSATPPWGRAGELSDIPPGDSPS